MVGQFQATVTGNLHVRGPAGRAIGELNHAAPASTAAAISDERGIARVRAIKKGDGATFIAAARAAAGGKGGEVCRHGAIGKHESASDEILHDTRVIRNPRTAN